MTARNNIPNSTTNMNISDMVDPILIFGPPRDSLYVVFPITIIYSILFIMGMFGNILICIIIIRNKHLHTATNFYLFSLSISDLLLLVSGIPQDFYLIWLKWPYIFGNTFCVLHGVVAETSVNASTLTITLFTIERYLAICHPFVSHQMSKLSRAIKHVSLLWVVSLTLALPQGLQFGVTLYKGVTMCLQIRVIVTHYFEISTFLFFFAPIVLLIVLYSLIGLKLYKTNIRQDNLDNNVDNYKKMQILTVHNKKSSVKSTKRIIMMLVAVVVTFFVCWAPFHAKRLIAIYGTTEDHLAKSPTMLSSYQLLTNVMHYMSACINPILYNIMSNNFRQAFKKTMMQCSCHKTSQPTIQRRANATVPTLPNIILDRSAISGFQTQVGVNVSATRDEKIFEQYNMKTFDATNQDDDPPSCTHQLHDTLPDIEIRIN